VPKGDEFAPGVIGELAPVLELVAKHQGNRNELVEELRQAYFLNHAKRHAGEDRVRQQRKVAGNVLIGMSQYGLFDLDTNRLSDVGVDLLAAKSTDEQYDRLAKHLLLKVNGLDMLRVGLEALESARSIQKLPYAKRLLQHGFTGLSVNPTNHMRFLDWLEKADVIDAGRTTINEGKVQALTGHSLKDVDRWASYSLAERSALRIIRSIAITKGQEAMPVRQIYSLLEVEHVPMPADADRAKLWLRLERDGWITVTRREGRGSHSGTITASPKLIGTNLDELPDYIEEQIPDDLRADLSRPIEEHWADLEDPSPNKRGRALEILTIHIAHDLGLRFRKFRQRAGRTGGAEVDVIAEGVHLHFSRWLFQCKNVKRVALSALAKELGMATLLHAHVIALVTTGEFRGSVKKYADQLAREGPLQVVLVDGRTLRSYRKSGPSALTEALRSQAREVFKLKNPQIVDAPEADEE
jgi:Restriction endonuclease